MLQLPARPKGKGDRAKGATESGSVKKRLLIFLFWFQAAADGSSGPSRARVIRAGVIVCALVRCEEACRTRTTNRKPDRKRDKWAFASTTRRSIDWVELNWGDSTSSIRTDRAIALVTGSSGERIIELHRKLESNLSIQKKSQEGVVPRRCRGEPEQKNEPRAAEQLGKARKRGSLQTQIEFKSN